MYIYQNKNWPNFKWDEIKILKLLGIVKMEQGLLLGKMRGIGFSMQNNALLQTITEEISKSNKIEGQLLDMEQLRSSIAKKLGLKGKNIYVSKNVEAAIDITLDAIWHYDKKIDKKRLCAWHKKMFPEGKSGWFTISAGKYRDDKLGPMQIVSGAMGVEKVHYQAPAAKTLNKEMELLFKFINTSKLDNVLKAAITHLWFVILHPFDDGNGRIARILSEMLLARSEDSSNRFYSMSSQIEKKRKEYYKQLEVTQHGNLDITAWLEWFLNTLNGAIKDSENLLKSILIKANFWQKYRGQDFNARQAKMLNILFDGFNGNLTTTKWAKICKCSHDTATRDILDLVKRKILKQAGAGRTTHYLLAAIKNK